MKFNNRKLTAVEMQLYKQGKCICCGQERTQSFSCQPEVECIACYKLRTHINEEYTFFTEDDIPQAWRDQAV